MQQFTFHFCCAIMGLKAARRPGGGGFIKAGMQKKIFVQSLLLVLIPLLLFSCVNIVMATRSTTNNYKNSLAFGMKNIGSVVDSMFADMDRASLFIIGDREVKAFLLASPEEKKQKMDSDGIGAVYNTLIYLKNTSQAIHSIQILGQDGHVLTHGPMPMGISEEDVLRARELNGRAFWGVDQGAGLDGETVNHIYLCRLLRDPQNPATHVGTVKIYMDNARLGDFFQGETLQDTAYYIVDADGTARYTAGAPATQEQDALPAYGLLRQNASGVFLHGGNYVAPHRIAENGWYVFSVSVPVQLRAQTYTSIALLVVLAVLCFAFCLALAYTVSRNITRPLHLVVEHMQRFEEDFSTRVPVTGEGEAALLAGQFNTMAQHIQTLVDRVYLDEIKRRELELGALQAQVNPHFLYNTLDMVYWTAKMENAPQTSDMVDSLSHFFRRALTGPGEYTTVDNEIEHLRYYVLLRQQSKKPFNFDIDISGEVLSCKVVKLVL